jgi:hypothetical protein
MSLTRRQRKVWVVITTFATIALLASSFAPFFIL